MVPPVLHTSVLDNYLVIASRLQTEVSAAETFGRLLNCISLDDQLLPMESLLFVPGILIVVVFASSVIIIA